MNEDLKRVETKIDEHIKESVMVRERLKTAELKIELLEKGVMRNAIVGGIIGAMIGSGAPQAIRELSALILGH